MVEVVQGCIQKQIKGTLKRTTTWYRCTGNSRNAPNERRLGCQFSGIWALIVDHHEPPYSVPVTSRLRLHPMDLAAAGSGFASNSSFYTTIMMLAYGSPACISHDMSAQDRFPLQPAATMTTMTTASGLDSSCAPLVAYSSAVDDTVIVEPLSKIRPTARMRLERSRR